MEGAPRPLFCNGLQGKRTFQKDIVKVEKTLQKTRNNDVHRHVREAAKRGTSRNDSGHAFTVE